MRYNLIHLAQFRKFHSCETAPSKIVSQWSTNMNNFKGNLTGMILLDLHKAFDMVNHDFLLLRKLNYIE